MTSIRLFSEVWKTPRGFLTFSPFAGHNQSIILSIFHYFMFYPLSFRYKIVSFFPNQIPGVIQKNGRERVTIEGKRRVCRNRLVSKWIIGVLFSFRSLSPICTMGELNSTVTLIIFFVVRLSISRAFSFVSSYPSSIPTLRRSSLVVQNEQGSATKTKFHWRSPKWLMINLFLIGATAMYILLYLPFHTPNACPPPQARLER